MTLTQRIISVIQNCVGNKVEILHEPVFSGNELRYLQDCIDSNFVSYVGKFVDRFEADLCALTGAQHAIAVVNGTAALHIALLLAGVSRGDVIQNHSKM